jgi:hypothetical protein
VPLNQQSINSALPPEVVTARLAAMRGTFPRITIAPGDGEHARQVLLRATFENAVAHLAKKRALKVAAIRAELVEAIEEMHEQEGCLTVRWQRPTANIERAAVWAGWVAVGGHAGRVKHEVPAEVDG